MSTVESGSTSVLDERLRLGTGFGLDDRPWVVKALSGLVPHLSGWRSEKVDLEISVKERDGRDQRITLEAFLGGWSPLVATASDNDLDHAIADVRKELIRQIEDEKSRRDPSHHRASVKHPTP
jgi:ribosome-associated translation inhibitor RaiA